MRRLEIVVALAAFALLVFTGCTKESGECTYDTDCPGVLVCKNGDCVDACSSVECGDGEVCFYGNCIPEACTSASCTTPPGDPACYDLPGFCQEGLCRYDAVVGRSCEDADPCTQNDTCQAQGACTGTPLRCETPPAPVCKDAATLLVSASPGNCVSGECEYSAVEVPCPGGCENDACAGDPCEGVVCDQPPPDACLDTQTLRQFSGTGTCVGGVCQYPYEDVECEFGCAGGTCQGCTPNWQDTSECSCTPTECLGCTGTKPQSDGCGNDRQVACSPGPSGCAGPCCNGACCAPADVCYQNSCCAPDCAGRECGPDGCGGSCGDCPAMFVCQPDGSCLLQSTCPAPAAPAPTAFGFNYAPQEHLGKWVGSEYDLVADDFEVDLAVMASLGTRVVRIMLLPYALGMQIEQNGGMGNWDQAELDALGVNLPRVIERFRDFGIAVIPCFGPNAYYWNGPDASTKWWEFTYGSGGWNDFIQDLVAWSTEVVEMLETSTACSNVLYYELHNEVDYNVPAMSSLVKAQLQDIPVPAAKRGISLLQADRASELARDLADTGTSLAYVEFHPYPDRNANADISGLSALVRGQIPGARLLLGEFAGIFCENGQNEDLQMDTVLSVLDQGEDNAVTASLHWMLWDRAPGTTCDPASDAERTGLGYSPDQPRDSYGSLAARLGLIPGADFEQGLGGWFIGGVTTSVSLSLGGPSEADAATNLHYGRMTITAEGSHWFCSPQFPVSGSRLAVSGYVRSNSQNLSIGAHFYDAGGEVGSEEVPFTIESGWSFSNIQKRLGGRVLDIPPGATSSIVCVATSAPPGTGAASPVYVDLDALSAHAW